jgi:hypothetical protein
VKETCFLQRREAIISPPMNMFRNLLTVVLIVFGIGLYFGDPDKWTWVALGGPNAVTALRFCVEYRAFVVAFCAVVAVALWMTRKQY